MRVRIAETFTTSVARLERSERAAVKRAAFDFLAGPARPGHRLHRLVHSDDRGFWSLRVSRDLRIILHRTADEVVLCLADHHDRAYAWAAQRVGAPESPDRDGAVDLAPPPAQRSCARAAASAPRAGAPVGGDAAFDDAARRPPAAASRRGLRLARRASAPLARDGGLPNPPAPAPLVHLLRFFEDAQRGASHPTAPRASSDPAGPGGGQAVRRAAPLLAVMLTPWAAAGALDLHPLVAAGLALVQALCAAGWLRAHARRATRALEAMRDRADGEAATLAGALEALRRGEAPARPAPSPGGALARAWDAIEGLGRFLTLHPEDIRRLAARPVESDPAPP